ncbi:anti-sigma factor [Demequina sp. NBRC 110053]|uniref:anti-sigma factor n=1 Tax=Demequina sp. NBRC 110053 TaxID=1570342 RepID=UPI0009FD7F95|nr:anti-sigma factor [Demequina sp. NBRC 110053]
MSHPDDEFLAELALNGADPSDPALAEATPEQRARFDALRAMAARLENADSPAEPLLTPPARVWDAIVAELEADDSTDTSGDEARASVGAAAPAEPGTAQPSTAQPPRATGADELAARRSRRQPWWTVGAAAAAGVVIGGVGVGAVLMSSEDDADLRVVAQTTLTDLASEAGAGEAILEARPDGTQVLVIDTEFEELDDAYLEVWLIDESIEGMVSLGHLTSTTNEFVIPAGFDVAAFPIVDISVEPLDGVPTHSGASVTRGVLEL